MRVLVLVLAVLLPCPAHAQEAPDPPVATGGAPSAGDEEAYLARAAAGQLINDADAVWFRGVLAQAAAGSPRGQGLAAFAYERGRGTRRDLKEALRWARLAHDAGDPFGTFNLAHLLWDGGRSEGADRAESKALFATSRAGTEQLARAGDPLAQAALGFLCLSGLGGGRGEVKVAVEWYSRAAAAGERLGQYNLAILSSQGLLKDGPDGVDALDLWRRAALQGMPEAQFALAIAYRRGHGGPVDERRVLQWITAAAGQDHARARVELLRIALQRSDAALVKLALAGSDNIVVGPPLGGGRDLVALAAGMGDPEILRLMLEAGADPDRRHAGTGSTPLHAAVIAFKVATVRTLLEAGADPNAADNYGWSPLGMALEHDREEIASLLRKHGAGLDTPDRQGRLPLVRAAAWGDAVLVSALLRHGADPQAAEGGGLTACQAARNEGKEYVVELLRERGIPCRPPVPPPAK